MKACPCMLVMKAKHTPSLLQADLANLSTTARSSCRDTALPSLAASASSHAVRCTLRPLCAAATLRLGCPVLSECSCKSFRDRATPASTNLSEKRARQSRPGLVHVVSKLEQSQQLHCCVQSCEVAVDDEQISASCEN